MRHRGSEDADCAVTQALSVVGDSWSLLVVLEVVGGVHRFDDLQAGLGISRKVLAQRLAWLVEHGVLERRRYHEHPPRHEYHVTPAGRGLVPVLVALQDWGERFVLGDGTLTATAAARSLEARRMRRLVGTRVPPLTLANGRGGAIDPVSDDPWTVLYCYPGAYAADSAYPIDWDAIPGAPGCTLESVTFRDRIEAFTARGARVVGVSTQRADEQAAFARKQRLGFELLSDQDLVLTAALRLPTFLAGGMQRLKRLTLLVRRDRTIHDVLYPIADPVQSVEDVLTRIDADQRGAA